MIEKLNPGQFPVLQRPSSVAHFVQHSQSMPQRVEIPGGDLAETGFVKVTGEKSVDLYALCQNDGRAKTLSVKAIAYVDEGDNLRIHELTNRAPTDLRDPAHTRNGKARVEIGHVTKLCNLRWGFNLVIDPLTGYTTIEVDRESPIVGLKLQFD
uniref:Uncharacterized protein n=1 Tax=Pseudomonas phage RVTF4 TaxID=3236931 RepID=A0AB39CCD5_9VIRU